MDQQVERQDYATHHTGKHSLVSPTLHVHRLIIQSCVVPRIYM